MNIISAFIKGIIYSFSMLTPVSYTGHEGLFRFLTVNLTKGGYDSILPLVIQLPVIISLLYFLKRDLKELYVTLGSLLKDIKEKKFDVNTKDYDKKFLLMILFGAFVLILTPLFSFIFRAMSSNLLIISFAFIVSSFFIMGAQRVKEKNLKESNETILNAIATSFFKLLACLPGISGIGGMYFAGVYNGFRREVSLKFAYIITLIFTVFSFIGNVISLFIYNINISYSVFYYIFLFMGALGAGGFSIYLYGISVKNKKTYYFAVYNIVIAVITFAIWLRG